MKPINGRELRNQLRMPVKVTTKKMYGFDTVVFYDRLIVGNIRARVRAANRLSVGIAVSKNMVRHWTENSE